jgi:uncharacterized protein (TIGR00297 family)
MTLPLRLLLGAILSLTVALVAYRAHSLSRSGVAGAVLTGTLILGFGGWAWGLALIAFFVSSSLLTRWRKARKAALEALAAKGSRRDIGQALANGGLAALLAVLAALVPHPAWAAAFAGALAAATADTWATEIGTLSPTPPRCITTGEVVPPGTSGGVTRWGTLAGAGGALFLGAVFYALNLVECGALGWPCLPSAAGRWTILPLALAGGLAGSLADSLLGATWQGIYRCPRCGQETERRVHCGGPTVLVRGRPWLTNDTVNFLATLVGATVAGALTFLC